MLDGPISPFVEKMLDFTAKRQQALSTNLANLDTPGYKSKDVKFTDELSAAGSSTQMIEDQSNPKPNGNTVDLESQMTKLNQNGLQYVLLVQYMSSEVKSLRYSISEGTKG